MKNKITKINRHNDVLMKYIFANEARKANTLSLINAVLDAQGRPLLIDLEFQDREIDPEHINDKGVFLDVLGKTSDNITINVEIQSSYYKHMTYRTLYYWTKLYTLNSGEDDNKLRRTISINILDFILFKKILNDHHSMFMLLNVNNQK